MIVLGPIVTRLSYKCLALKGWQQKMIIGAILIPLLLAGFLADHVFEQHLESFDYTF